MGLKSKDVASGLAVIFHIYIMMWYYSRSEAYVLDNKAFVKLMVHGVGYLLVAFNIFIRCDNLFHREVVKVHGAFVAVLGVINLLFYSGYSDFPFSKLHTLFGATLLILAVVLLSALKNGYFKEKS